MAGPTLGFLHDSNAAGDGGLVMLRERYGWAGYGLYWRLIEQLRREKNCQMPLDTLAPLTKDLGSEIDLGQLVEFCVKNKILFKSNEKFFWSPTLRKRVRQYEQARKRMSDGGKRGQLRQKVLASTGRTSLKGGQLNITKTNKTIEKIITVLNTITGKHFRVVDDYKVLIINLLQRGYKFEDFNRVMKNKSVDPWFKARPHLMNPTTLFKPSKFDGYLNEDPTKYEKDSQADQGKLKKDHTDWRK